MFSLSETITKSRADSDQATIKGTHIEKIICSICVTLHNESLNLIFFVLKMFKTNFFYDIFLFLAKCA